MMGHAILTDAGVPSEDIPVKDVERKVPKAARYFTVEVFSIKRTARENGVPLSVEQKEM